MPTRAPHDLTLRITLLDTAPPIWRLVRVPESFSLHQLHRTVQLLFGWQDRHLHEFEIGARTFEPPDAEAEGESSAGVRLDSLGLAVGDRFTYCYDLGDDWEHEIRIEAKTPSAPDDEEPGPVLLDGARAGPPEDCGGTAGFAELLEDLARPRTRAGRESRRWVGALYDPALFDRWQVGRMLTLVAQYGVI
ncbi:MAG: plasmid pRiA4b ORF-3 family protein [Gemmatimonadales bacterium]|nr:plasmid pRiA4b ORF-3 family protein [Gemmatimonadales bacterium]